MTDEAKEAAEDEASGSADFLSVDEAAIDFQPVDWKEIGRQLVPHGDLVIEEEGEDLRLTWPLSGEDKTSYTAVIPKVVAQALVEWLGTRR